MPPTLGVTGSTKVTSKLCGCKLTEDSRECLKYVATLMNKYGCMCSCHKNHSTNLLGQYVDHTKFKYPVDATP